MSGVCAPIKRAARSASKLTAIAFAGFCAAALPTQAHPHVFVDGGVDFVVRDGKILEAVKVTWLYDPFETLYILSSYELSLNDQGDLSEGDRQTLVTHRSQWPSDFDGSTHLTRDGEVVPLSRPIGFAAALVNGQLQVTFTRVLETPIDLNAKLLFVDLLCLRELVWRGPFQEVGNGDFFSDGLACACHHGNASDSTHEYILQFHSILPCWTSFPRLCDSS